MNWTRQCEDLPKIYGRCIDNCHYGWEVFTKPLAALVRCISETLRFETYLRVLFLIVSYETCTVRNPYRTKPASHIADKWLIRNLGHAEPFATQDEKKFSTKPMWHET